ncbi:MAG: flagellar motor protein MotB [Paracoccus denitrificans]|nr:MAG: flagellar motor protein MotB [Paracoccus denitrificans]PZO83363.1 MAG: flagellar motor protein MotB [Paracoccus denitrificans]
MVEPTLHPAPKRRRVRGFLLGTVLLGLAATGSWYGAERATAWFESDAVERTTVSLTGAGFDWVDVKADGLNVILTGSAPDEVTRMRAIAQAGGAVSPTRIVDDMQIAASTEVAAPPFRIELLRGDTGLSLAGLVPASLDRADLIDDLKQATGQSEISDLLEATDAPTPDGWNAAVRFGLTAASQAPRSKVSISPGKVSITASTDSAADQTRLTERLTREKPADVELTTDITAPLPVISPFVLRLVKDDAGVRFDSCSADTDDARSRIIDAARSAGAVGQVDCTLGLGTPTPDWAGAATAGIDAVRDLSQATLTMSGTEISLTAPSTVSADEFQKVTTRLEAALPDIFSLTTHLQQPVIVPVEGPAEFTATVDQGNMTMRGAITNDQMRDAVESFAKSRFDVADDKLSITTGLPEGWTVRVIAALDAVTDLDSGTVRVTPDMVRVTGISGNPSATDDTVARLSHRLGAGSKYEIALRYDRRLDGALNLPSGQECVDRLNRVMQESEIGFEPNGGKIAGDPTETMQRLSDAMTDCTDYRIEIGGHTDSQGSEGFNAELSRTRAQAVMAAMEGAGIKVSHLTSRGYGESEPIADNDTEAGREANRRIEFKLLSDAPLDEPPAPAQPVVGETQAGVAPPQDDGPDPLADAIQPLSAVGHIAAGVAGIPHSGEADPSDSTQPDPTFAPAED